jgi:hypothetical protein
MNHKRNRPALERPEVLPHFDVGDVTSVDELMAFDRQICASGCKRFLRDLTVFDFPLAQVHDLWGQGQRYIVVEELWAGARTRQTASGYVITRHDLCQN